jgi:protein ImuA
MRTSPTESLAPPGQPLISQLRQSLFAVERTNGLVGECSASVNLGIGAIDAALGGGLACGSLHELAAAREAEIAAATAFALAVTTLWIRQSCQANRSFVAPAAERTSTGRALLWIAEDLSLSENGLFYGPGLEEAGIPPERLITVAAPHMRDVLWVTEEALRCRAVGTVISELRARAVEPTVTRRLSLAAAAGGTLGLVLRPHPDNEPGAFATRWIIGAAASLHSSPSQRRGGIGPPRLTIRLVRNRRGHLGAWIVEWNSVEQRFELATDSEPMVGATFDRSNRAAVA